MKNTEHVKVKHQTPNIKHQKSSKDQIPSSKEFPNPKSQMRSCLRVFLSGRIVLRLRFGGWIFFGVWSLVFGVSAKVFGASLSYDACR